MSIEREYNRKFINEMATIGICDGKKVVTNSLDHGQPHIHYGGVKIYLPNNSLKNATELRQYVDEKYQDQVKDTELTKLVRWFDEKSRINSKQTNLEMSWIAWHLEHPGIERESHGR